MAETKHAPAPVTSQDELVAYIEAGAKSEVQWRIGTEHEKFGFHVEDLSPLPYAGPRGIRAMLEGLQRFGWAPVYEGENVIGLTLDGQSITLEPGGQFELSGAPLETLHQTCEEVHTHLEQVKAVAADLGIAFAGFGFHPKLRLEDVPIMPKARYDIMRRYMPTRGALGLNMMLRTCTVQVNLDYASEADMVRKLRVGLALQPISTALFANSPFTEGRPNGYLSYRSHVWTDTDPDRTGMLPFAFEAGMGFERYVGYALDVPMYFVKRNDRYVDVTGQSFRDFLEGRLAGLPGERPTLADWESHLTTIFPEVRLKTFLEMRGADGGPWRRLCALPALWAGLLYDSSSLDAAWDLVKDWTAEERMELRIRVPKTALATRLRNRTVLEIARDVLDIAEAGLNRRNRRDGVGDTEAHFLDALRVIAEEGKTPAEHKLEAFHGRWQGSVDPIFAELAY